MRLDDFLKSSPVTPASKPVNLLPEGGTRGDKEPPMLSSDKIKSDAESFFSGQDAQRKIKIDVAAGTGDATLTPPLIAAAEGLNGVTAGSPAYEVKKPAMELLDTFAPDISDLARTGLPLSGFDIPDEKAIREQLRKILRRL